MVQVGNKDTNTMLTINHTEMFLVEAAVAAPAPRGWKPVSGRRTGDVPALARRRVR